MITETGDPNSPTNLRTFDGADTFSGKDCTMLWDSPIDSTSIYENYVDSTGNTIAVYSGNSGKIKQYKVEVYDTDTLTLRRTYYTASENEREYTYFYADNLTDNNGTPVRDLTFKIYSISLATNISDAITLAVSNPAPDMSSSLPTVTPRPMYLEIEWPIVSDFDMSYYHVYFGTTNPPTELIAKIYHPNVFCQAFNVNYGTDYYIQIQPFDGFGSGVKSQVPAAVSPLLIPDINVNLEVRDSVTITTDASYTGTLTTLYDGTFSSGGIGIANPNEKYIQYAYEIENYFDRIGIWSLDTNPHIYIAYSEDGDTWSYLSGEADHTLTADSELVANTEANAITNYWTLAAGMNIAYWPNNLTAKYVRVYFVNSNSTTIYEIVPSRILISELAAIEALSAISANIGTVVTGLIQSSNYPTSGLKIDIDNGEIVGAITFKSGTGGYSQISDKPTDLSDINVTEGSKLTGIENNATDDSNWRHLSDITKIDGGKLFVGSQIVLNEGGSATFGDSNVIIDTTGDHGSIIIAPDGGIDEQNYCHLTDGDIQFYRYIDSDHRPYTSMTRIESGAATSGDWVEIPGYWVNSPVVMVSPKSVQGYSRLYPNFDQSMKVEAAGLQEFSEGRWKFKASAYNELTNGTTSGDWYSQRAFVDYTDTTVTCLFPANTATVTWSLKWGAGYRDLYSVRPANVQVLVYYYYNGGANNILLYDYTMTNNDREFYTTLSYNSEDHAADPYSFSIRIIPTGNYFHNKISWNYPPEFSTFYWDYGLDLYPLEYSATLDSATILSGGTLSWIATGR